MKNLLQPSKTKMSFKIITAIVASIFATTTFIWALPENFNIRATCLRQRSAEERGLIYGEKIIPATFVISSPQDLDRYRKARIAMLKGLDLGPLVIDRTYESGSMVIHIVDPAMPSGDNYISFAVNAGEGRIRDDGRNWHVVFRNHLSGKYNRVLYVRGRDFENFVFHPAISAAKINALFEEFLEEHRPLLDEWVTIYKSQIQPQQDSKIGLSSYHSCYFDRLDLGQKLMIDSLYSRRYHHDYRRVQNILAAVLSGEIKEEDAKHLLTAVIIPAPRPDAMPYDLARNLTRRAIAAVSIKEESQPLNLARQLRQAVIVENIVDLQAMIRQAQQIAGKKHPNLCAALKTIVAEDYSNFEARLRKTRDLAKQYKLTPEEENTLKLCLDLDWEYWEHGIVKEFREITPLVQQIKTAVTVNYIEGWVAIAEQAQQIAGEEHPNLVAALEVVKLKDYNHMGVSGLRAEVEDLTKKHHLTPEETSVIRFCLGLDWGQGIDPEAEIRQLEGKLNELKRESADLWQQYYDWLHREVPEDVRGDPSSIADYATPEVWNIVQAARTTDGEISKLEASLQELRGRFHSQTPQLESSAADLRTCDEIMKEMYGRHPGLFKKMGTEHLTPLFRAGRYDDIVNYLEKEFLRLAVSDKVLYPPSEINMFRFAWAEWLLEGQHPVQARVLLEKDVPGETFPLAYRIMYQHLIGETYRGEAIQLLQEGNIDKGLVFSRQATTHFKKVDILIAQESARLKGLAIDASLEGRRQDALYNLERLKETNNYALNTADSGVIVAITRLPLDRIDSRILIELVARGDAMLARHGRGELKQDNLGTLQTGIVSVYISLHRARKEIPPDLTQLFYRIIATVPGRRIVVPGLGSVELTLPSPQPSGDSSNAALQAV